MGWAKQRRRRQSGEEETPCAIATPPRVDGLQLEELDGVVGEGEEDDGHDVSQPVEPPALHTLGLTEINLLKKVNQA